MIQYRTIVLPQAGSGFDLVGDVVQHISVSCLTYGLDHKVAYIYATGSPAAALAPLQAWVEISPDATATNFTLLGTQVVFVNQPVFTRQNKAILWTADSTYARIVLQCPNFVAGTGGWTCWVVFEGRAIVP